MSSTAPRRGLLRLVAAYGLSRGVTEGLLTLRSVLLAALLGPAGFGSWALLRLGMRYAALGRLGVLRGLEVELMRGDGTGESSAGRAAAPTAFGFVLLVAALISAAALGIAGLVQQQDYRLLLGGFAAASFAEAVYGYVLVCLRMRGSLRQYARLETSTAVLHLLLAVGLARFWGLAGAFGGLALANAIGIAGGARWADFRLALAQDQLRRLFAVGFPITLTSCVGILLVTGDRWIVTWWGGVTMLGYYAFAASAASAAAGLGIVIRTVVFRDVYGQAASAGTATALQTHFTRSLLPFARLLPPLLGAIGVAAGPLVALGLPQYIPAIASGRLFLLAGAAVGLINLATIGAVAAGRQRGLPLYATAALGLTTGLALLALRAGGGLEGVAWAALAGHLFFAAAVLRLLVRETGTPGGARVVGSALLPVAWCAAAVAVVGRLFPSFDPASAALGIGVYLLLMFPLLPQVRGEWRRLLA